MTTYRGPMARAVGSAITAANPADLDGAAVALARRYAALIDAAQPAAKYGKHLAGVRAALEWLEQIEPLSARSAIEHFDKIAEALAAHSVASDLGPKLLAALTALNMTAAARGLKGGATGDAPTTAEPTTTDRLRAQRKKRAARAGVDGTAAVDSAAP